MRLLSLIAVFAASAAWARSPGPDMEEAADTAVPVVDTGGAPCSDQWLRDGVQLPERPGLFVMVEPSASWGTETMIETILQAAQEMAWQMPDRDPILVGDISWKHGGTFEGHRSHRGGLDADLGIWDLQGQGRTGFRDVAPNQLDAKATWTFLKALLETGNVERIYLDQSLINVLRRYARLQEGLTAEEVDRIFPPPGTPKVWSMTGVVQHVAGHRNHIHLRVLCDDGQQSQ